MKALINGKIVTPTEILENKVVIIKDDRILDIVNTIEEDNFEQVINVHNRYIMPGFIDTHSDKIEQLIQPRPTSTMDFDLAFKECERELLLQGITTMYHSLSLYKNEFFGKSPLRTKENVLRIAKLINSIHERNHLIHHRFHLRIEIDNLEAYEIAKSMIEDKKVHLISFMDHTPGQGQYKNLDIYKKTISSYEGNEITSLGFDGVLGYHENKEILTFEQLKELCNLAHENGISVASHDDDTVEKLYINKKIGVDVSEFSITIDVAREARKMGFFTVAGAPNILLGGSHSGNMSASEAILSDCVDILCSDYYPPAMLHSIFIMEKNFNVPLVEMVKKVTLNPAIAMKIDKEYGSIEIGKKADVLVVDILDGYPVITQSLVDGIQTSLIEYRR